MQRVHLKRNIFGELGGKGYIHAKKSKTTKKGVAELRPLPIRNFYRYLQRKFISVKIIVVVSAGRSEPDKTLRWAGSGPRAVICSPLV